MTTHNDRSNDVTMDSEDDLYAIYTKLEKTQRNLIASARNPSELDELRKAATAIETARAIVRSVGNARLTGDSPVLKTEGK